MAKKKTSKSKGKAPAQGTSALAPSGSAALFERFLPEAEKLPKGTVQPMHADVNLALTNARRGVKAVLGKKDQLKGVPDISLDDVATLPDLGLAVAYAAGQVERFAPPPKQVRKMLSRAHELRAMMLASAQALASAGLLQENAVQKIRRGHGGIDAAGDCVALAALFRENAATIRGKHPVMAAEIKEAADLGTQLLGVLSPKSARTAPSSLELKRARDQRDRLWTLFTQRWEHDVWRGGAWVFGRKVGKYVPPLLSHAGRRQAAKKKPAADKGAAE